MKTKQLNILIVGAGIGGLCAALALMKNGHRVKVCEQATQLSEVGAGIQLSANSTKALRAIGVLDDVLQICVKPKGVRMCLFDTGETIYESSKRSDESLFGAPYIHVHRADIHNVLAEHVKKADPEAIILNAQMTSFHETDKSITLKLADGRHFEGDLLIGADGLKSVVRNQVHGPEKPNWTGNVAWRAIVPTAALPKNFMDRVVTNFVGPGKHAVVYYLRKEQLVNLVGVVESEPKWREESWVTKAPWEELKADYAGWNKTLQTLIDAVDKDKCYRWALYNRLPIDNWSTARATLLGDAAHATLPFFAQGAAMAIEDGIVLSRAIEQEDTLPNALKLYQNNRMARTARIQLASTENGKIYHQPDAESLKSAIQQRFESPAGNELLEWLYSYDPVTVPLQ